jgi:hypothetical protein
MLIFGIRQRLFSELMIPSGKSDGKTFALRKEEILPGSPAAVAQRSGGVGSDAYGVAAVEANAPRRIADTLREVFGEYTDNR